MDDAPRGAALVSVDENPSSSERNYSRRGFFGSLAVTMSGILVSRVLGLFRDMATAALLGMSGSPEMDALVLALRVPNLFRGLLGEGALAASFLPIFSQRWQHDRRSAGQLAAHFLTQLTVILAGVVVLGEVVCYLLWLHSSPDSGQRVLWELLATTLPYVLLICLSAQLTAMLTALGNFRLPAALPSLLNLIWLAGACWLAPTLATTPAGQAQVLAGCVVVAGAIQVALQWPALRRAGVRLEWRRSAAVAGSLGRIWRGFGAMTVGLAITQINTLIDSLLAWGLAAPADVTMHVAESGWRYPLHAGATTALYLAERMYQLPLGLLGMATATVIFPRLARLAARHERQQLTGELNFGLRFVLLLALPASVGLIVLAEPIARLLFERGQFTADDTQRTARVIAAYATGIWAYCLLPVIVRGYYALGDRRTPIVLGAAAVALNLSLDLTLVWPLGEVGLACSTAISAMVQVVALGIWFSRRHARLDAQPIIRTALRAAAASLTTGLTVVATLVACQASISPAHWFGRMLHVALPLTVGVLTFAVAASWWFRQPPGQLLLGGSLDEAGS